MQPNPISVRQRVDRWIASNLRSSANCNETVLISNNHYIGHRFEVENYSLVWKSGQDQIDIYQDGQLIQQVELTDSKTNRAA